jgi:vacuolar-type H+-ATPase subunit D/Vma8
MTKRELESREDVAKTLLTQQELAIQKFDKIIDDIKDTRRLVDKSRSDAKILHFKTAEMRKKAKQEDEVQEGSLQRMQHLVMGEEFYRVNNEVDRSTNDMLGAARSALFYAREAYTFTVDTLEREKLIMAPKAD